MITENQGAIHIAQGFVELKQGVEFFLGDWKHTIEAQSVRINAEHEARQKELKRMIKNARAELGR